MSENKSHLSIALLGAMDELKNVCPDRNLPSTVSGGAGYVSFERMLGVVRKVFVKYGVMPYPRATLRDGEAPDIAASKGRAQLVGKDAFGDVLKAGTATDKCQVVRVELVLVHAATGEERSVWRDRTVGWGGLDRGQAVHLACVLGLKYLLRDLFSLPYEDNPDKKEGKPADQEADPEAVPSESQAAPSEAAAPQAEEPAPSPSAPEPQQQALQQAPAALRPATSVATESKPAAPLKPPGERIAAIVKWFAASLNKIGATSTAQERAAVVYAALANNFPGVWGGGDDLQDVVTHEHIEALKATLPTYYEARKMSLSHENAMNHAFGMNHARLPGTAL